MEWEVLRIGFLSIHLRDALDILLTTFLLAQLYRWVRHNMLWGIGLFWAFLWGLQKLVVSLGFSLLGQVLQILIWVLAASIVIYLAPELRRLLQEMRNWRLFENLRLRKNLLTREKAEEVTEEILSAIKKLRQKNLGALIVIEGNDNLQPILTQGDPLHARVESRFLEVIFQRESPLHDGAVILRGEWIVGARCTLPLTEQLNLPPELGLRHRAALGLSEGYDALVIVLSEETGIVSLAYQGKLQRDLPIQQVRQRILNFLQA
ncbi:MAG: diadenylate cyclase [Bacteroidia bacterium]